MTGDDINIIARKLSRDWRRNVQATGVLREELDAKYVAMRQELTNVMISVALICETGWDAAALGMALLNVYRVDARTVHAEGLEPELAAGALLGVAICFVKDLSSGGCDSSLSTLATRWNLQVERLQPQRLRRKPAELDYEWPQRESGINAAQVKAAQVKAAQQLNALDWRLSVATADVLLERMHASDLRSADDRISRTRTDAHAELPLTPAAKRQRRPGCAFRGCATRARSVRLTLKRPLNQAASGAPDALAACLALSCVPGADAQQLFGIKVSDGVMSIFVVAIFLFVVPCITKAIHVIRKLRARCASHELRARCASREALTALTAAASCSGRSSERLTAARAPRHATEQAAECRHLRRQRGVCRRGRG